MAYSLQTKKEVVEKIQQGMKIGKVAAMYGVSRQAINNWLRSPEKYLSETRQARTPFDLEEKVRILHMMESSGLTARQVAELKNLSLHTILGWVKDKDRIFAVYSSQGQVPVNTGITISPGEEVPSVSTPDDKDTKQHIRSLKEENEYLKARVAYLEALMELNGTPVSELKKNAIPGHRQSPRRRDRNSEPSLPHSERLPEKLLPPSPASVFSFRHGDHRYHTQPSGRARRQYRLPAYG